MVIKGYYDTGGWPATPIVINRETLTLPCVVNNSSLVQNHITLSYMQIKLITSGRFLVAISMFSISSQFSIKPTSLQLTITTSADIFLGVNIGILVQVPAGYCIVVVVDVHWTKQQHDSPTHAEYNKLHYFLSHLIFKSIKFNCTFF